jgi:hypothetical protein
MPKRKVKEEKPRKKLGKKQILLPPVIVGAATLAGILIMYFVPHPPVLDVCLKKNAADPFNVYPRIQIVVDGDTKLMPDDVGNIWKDGKECLRVIRTDAVGDVLHVQYIRPIRLTMDDFMKIYSYDNRTISVMDNSTGTPKKEILTLKDFNIDYSYFSEKGEFTRVIKPSDIPPFTNDLVVRIQLRSK